MKRKEKKPVWLLVLLDLLLGAAILAVFFFFKLGLPILLARQTAPAPTPQPTAVQPTETPAPTPAPTAAEPTGTPAPTAEPTPEPTPDPRTPWQIRFADAFRPTVELTDHSYKSPTTSIELQTFTRDFQGRTSVYHVADVYVASPEQFATYTANDELKYFSTQAVEEMDAASASVTRLSRIRSRMKKPSSGYSHHSPCSIDNRYSTSCATASGPESRSLEERIGRTSPEVSTGRISKQITPKPEYRSHRLSATHWRRSRRSPAPRRTC